MNALIEKFKRNEILDAIWYSNVYGKNVEELTLRNILGPVGDIDSIGQLILGKYRLVLICSNQEPSLADNFSTDKELADFIREHKKTINPMVIKKHSHYIYVLNIKTVQYIYDLHNRGLTKELLNNAVSIYTPLIQAFMVDAITDTLEIEGSLYVNYVNFSHKDKELLDNLELPEIPEEFELEI